MSVTTLGSRGFLTKARRRRNKEPAGSHRRFGAWLGGEHGALGLGVIVLAGALALATWVLWDAHRDVEAQANRTVQNLAQALERDTARNIELYDLAFQDVITALQLPGLQDAAPELRRAALFSNISQARYMSALLVLNEAGDIAYDSNNVAPRQVNFADRDYFKVHRDHADAGLYISKPLLSRFDQFPNLAISRRLAHPDGSFAGVVVTGIRLAYFQSLFASLDLGVQGSVTLLRDDGVLLARWPADLAQIGRDLRGAAVLQHLRDAPSGTFQAFATLDGVERIYGYRRVGSYPLVINVALGKAAAFAPWRQKAAEVSAIMAVLIGLAALLARALRRELRRRMRAEQAAQRSAQEAVGSAGEARQTARELADTLEQLDALLTNSADALFVARRQTNGEFAYEVLNPRVEALTGLPAWAMHGRTPAECLPPAAARSVETHWQQCAVQRRIVRYDHIRPLPEGWRAWETLLVPVLDRAGAVCLIVGTSRDMTESKRAADELRTLNDDLEARVEQAVAARQAALARATQAERMQALGLLASGVAHDFNNVLQAVSGYAELIECRSDDAVATRRLARLAVDAAGRGAAITGRLLAFSRRGELRADPVDVTGLLDGLQEMLGHTLDAAIAVRTDVAPGLTPVLADKGQLETVLLNLAANARDAMPGGGTLVLAAAADEVRRGAKHPAGLTPGRYIRLSIIDTGAGMSTATLARVAEPFFTTKAAGKGTGLGLSMARGFAEQSGGQLAIESRPGHGTTVTVWLPEAGLPEAGLIGAASGLDAVLCQPASANESRLVLHAA